MDWRQFVMNLESIDPDHIEAVLMENGAQSVTLTDAGDNPVLEPAPGETPLWANTRITALFNAHADFDALRVTLLAALQLDELPPNHIEDLADRAWEREWLKDFGPMQFGKKLWVVPGESDVPPADSVVVKLDPGLAFGTGTHPTTAMCLGWLDGIDLNGRSIFDFGCGSGILSVAALKLGASRAEAVDIDLQAVAATRQNAERNDVGDRLVTNTEVPDRQFDVVVANILAGTLIENTDLICRHLKPGANLALSGILVGQAESVLEAFDDHIDFAAPITLNEWALLSGTRS
ncbi:MAG: 50S ribosomal protein L11 methyltransferase [Gammaproteobacteria bacterium]|nr:50S ribosomal protein L11 methyltransferase [Gammaproteobacteria bacterium]